MTTLSLDSLRDIHLPPEPALVAWLSPWSISAIAMVLLVAIFLAIRHRLRQQPQRHSMRELTRLVSAHALGGDGTALARGLSQLLRRHAIERYGMDDIAALTGRDWLGFLDEHGGEGQFCNGIGATLETRPYQADGDFDAKALAALVRQWLQENRL